MKRMKNLLALLAVLVVLMAATFAARKWNPENQVEETIPAEVVFTLDAETVTALSWDYSEALNFEKEGDTWVYADDPVFALDESFITSALEALVSVESSKTIEDVEDFDQYGLEVPVCAITVTAGETYELAIGQETTMGGERYFSVGDGNVYLVDEEIIDTFSYGLYDLLTYETIPDMTDVMYVTVSAGEESFTLNYQENSGLSYSDEYVWFLNDEALDTELTESFLSNVTGLSWIECVNYNAEDLSAYGLDDPAATVKVRYILTEEESTSAQDFILEIGDDTGDGCYARIAGSNMVYLIDSAVREAMLYTTSADLMPDEVILLDWEEVTAFDFTLNGETCTVTRDTKTVTDDEGNETEETVYLLNGEEVDISGITDVLDDLTSAGYAAGLTPERSEEIRIVFHRDRETFPEVELAFYAYNSSACLTTLNGASTVLADRTGVAALVEAVNELILG